MRPRWSYSATFSTFLSRNIDISILLIVSFFLANVNARRNYPANCSDRNLSLLDRVKAADVILTGTVGSKTSYDISTKKYSIYVLIKRVLKDSRPETHSDLTTMTQVEWSNETNFCLTRVYPKDTKIFLLSKMDDPETMALSSSIMHISLTTLRKIDAILRGKQYQPRKIEKLPCEKILCGFGADCLVNQTTAKAYCSCDGLPSCDKFIFAPVCASNNVTYPSECHMLRSSCVHQQSFAIHSSGECSKDDPCEPNPCGNGFDCVRSIDGKSKECLCPEVCYSLGDSEQSSPVCGSDWHEYDSQCELKRHACTKLLNTTVLYRGVCDPCSMLEQECKSQNLVCKLNEYREPECRCNGNCGFGDTEVCGTNGHTYPTECHLNVERCKLDSYVQVAKYSSCKNAKHPCNESFCESIHGECYHNLQDRTAAAVCKCTVVCPQVIKPVCGSDTKTYPNECLMKKESCNRKRPIFVDYQGICGKGKCRGFRCPQYQECEEINGKPVCKCPQCHNMESRPLCASNGLTYENTCKLREYNCKTGSGIYELYAKPCTNCANRTEACRYDIYQYCEDKWNNSTCVCHETCEAIKSYVCGINGKTYDNLCQLQLDSCKTETQIAVNHRGSCDSCDANRPCSEDRRCHNNMCTCKDCSHETGPRVCATNHKYYTSQCHMERDACQTGARLLSVHLTYCREKVMPESNVCLEYDYGCCDDGITKFVPGGCPNKNTCRCHRAGAFQVRCNALGQCDCKPGVTGKTCNRCISGYYGLGHQRFNGCKPCQCSFFGTKGNREDCKQNHGECVCAVGVTGRTCNRCVHPDMELRPGGCVSKDAPYAKNCEEMKCAYEAICEMQADPETGSNIRYPVCICRSPCPTGPTRTVEEAIMGFVCGSDYVTYENECSLRYMACQKQEVITVARVGRCSDDAGKTTRDLNEGKKKQTSTTAIGQLTVPTQLPEALEFINDVCRENSQCSNIKNSKCQQLFGKKECLCLDGYKPAADRRSCEQTSPCDSGPCANKGICVTDAHDPSRYSCQCQTSFVGKTCKDDEPSSNTSLYNMPKFTSTDSELRLPGFVASQSMTMEFEFKPRTNDGVILYIGRDDYFMVRIDDLYLNFVLNLGWVSQGTQNPSLRFGANHLPKLTLDEWNWVRFVRAGQKIEISLRPGQGVDTKNIDLMIPSANYKSSQLNLKGYLYMGRVPEQFSDQALASMSPGHDIAKKMDSFEGCVMSLKVDNNIYDLRVGFASDISHSQSIESCGANPCSGMPCRHDGKCIKKSVNSYSCDCKPGFSGLNCKSHDVCEEVPCGLMATCLARPNPQIGTKYTCICPTGKTGHRCETDMTQDKAKYILPSAELKGTGFIQYSSSNIPFKPDTEFRIRIDFIPRSNEGLLIFLGSFDLTSGFRDEDYFAISLYQGHVHFIYELGHGPANIRSQNKIVLDQFNYVEVHRKKRQGEIMLNGGLKDEGESPHHLDVLNSQKFSSLFIGGLRQFDGLPTFPGLARVGFTGVIRRVVCDGKWWPHFIHNGTTNSAVRLLHNGPCKEKPCNPSQLCEPIDQGYNCRDCDPTQKWCKSPKNTFHGAKSIEYMADESPEQKATSIRDVSFDGNLHLSYSFAKSQQKSAISFALETHADNGIIMWQSKNPKNRHDSFSDFLAIGLTNGRIFVLISLGQQHLDSINSSLIINDGRPHTVEFKRDGRETKLQVDSERKEKIISDNSHTKLDTDGDLWIGGHKMYSERIPQSLRLGYVGCLFDVEIEGKMLNLKRGSSRRRRRHMNQIGRLKRCRNRKTR